MDFSLAHFTDFNFAHFEIEESFGLIWAKLQNDRFHSQIFFRVFKKCLFQVWALSFSHFVYN